MNPKLIWLNLAVSDLQRTIKFYTDLGFKPYGNAKEPSFQIGKDDLIMHFFVRDSIETNLETDISKTQQHNEVFLTLTAESIEQVDNWAKEVMQAGGRLISLPEDFGKGYYGFVFADPEGHKFNVFYVEAFRKAGLLESTRWRGNDERSN